MAETGTSVDSGNLSRKVVSVAAGEAHTLVLTGDGSVYSWGRGTFGRLGTGSEHDRLFPIRVGFGSGADRVKIVGVAAGVYHNLALSDDGSVWSWGHNTYGQLGVNGENSLVPSLMEGFHGLSPPDGSIKKSEAGLKIKSVKAGGMMSLAIDDLGSLWIWGNCPPEDIPNEGEFSLVSTYTPTPVWAFHGQIVVKVACGSEHIVALVSAGETHKDDDLVCYAWGNNNHGQLGLGDTDFRATPQIIETFNTESSWTAYELACGAFHTSVLAYKKEEYSDTSNSVCWTFGLGDNGQLGHGTTKKALLPEIVNGLRVNMWLISVDCGLFHTSVVSSNGDVWSWGMENGSGLSPEASEGGDSLNPRFIQGNGQHGSNFPEPVQVACGAAHTVLVADNGYKLWSWGRGRSGVLGNDQVNDFFNPTLVLWPPLQEDFNKNGAETISFKRGDKIEGEKSSVDITKIEEKLIITERYASILHGSIFGKPFEEEKDITDSLKKADSFDVGKEWENMLESCDYDKLVRLEMFYRKKLKGVKDKMMKQRIKEMIKECLESSTSIA